MSGELDDGEEDRGGAGRLLPLRPDVPQRGAGLLRRLPAEGHRARDTVGCPRCGAGPCSEGGEQAGGRGRVELMADGVKKLPSSAETLDERKATVERWM